MHWLKYYGKFLTAGNYSQWENTRFRKLFTMGNYTLQEGIFFLQEIAHYGKLLTMGNCSSVAVLGVWLQQVVVCWGAGGGGVSAPLLSIIGIRGVVGKGSHSVRAPLHSGMRK